MPIHYRSTAITRTYPYTLKYSNHANSKHTCTLSRCTAIMQTYPYTQKYSNHENKIVHSLDLIVQCTVITHTYPYTLGVGSQCTAIKYIQVPVYSRCSSTLYSNQIHTLSLSRCISNHANIPVHSLEVNHSRKHTRTL